MGVKEERRRGGKEDREGTRKVAREILEGG